MLTTIASLLGGKLADTLLNKALGAFEAYSRKEISLEELRTRLHQAMMETFAEVEKAHADALAKTFGAFMDTMGKSLLVRAVWASVTLSQLLVLLWHQVGIPAVVYFTGHPYPSSGTTVEWAYLLLAGCVGLGPVVLRAGPGGSAGLVAGLKSLVGR